MDGQVFAICMDNSTYRGYLSGRTDDYPEGIFWGREKAKVFTSRKEANQELDEIRKAAVNRVTGETEDWFHNLYIHEMDECEWEVWFFVEKAVPCQHPGLKGQFQYSLTNDKERGRFVTARYRQEAMERAKELERHPRFNRVIVTQKTVDADKISN